MKDWSNERWRSIPSISLDVFTAEIARYERESGRKTEVLPMAREVHRTLGDYSTLGLAILAMECQYGAKDQCEGIKFNRHNPYNISCGWQQSSGHKWCVFSDVVEATRKFVETITAVTRPEATLAELLARYAPCHENDCERNLRNTNDRINRYLAAEGVVTTAPLDMTFKPPKPTIYDLAFAPHAAKFGVTPEEARRLRRNVFPGRRDGSIQGKPRYIVLHIQEGTTPGSLDWWLNGPGVQASSTYMVQRDGSVLLVVPEHDGPWTNGDVKNPTPASAGLRALGGNPNIWSITIEAEGWYQSCCTPAQTEAIVWLVMDLMGRYEIPIENVIPHASINSRDRLNCPGPYYNKVVDEVRQRMAQLPPILTPRQPDAPIYAAKRKMPTFEGKDVRWEGKMLYAIRRQEKLAKDTFPRQWADPESYAVGPLQFSFTEFQVSWMRKGADGKWWYATAEGSFFPVDSCVRQFDLPLERG